MALDKPEIKEGTSKEMVSWINHKTEITCEAEGVPLPDIIWDRDGTVISSKEFHSRFSTLTFTPQEASDFGDYVCKATNLLGLTEKIITIEMLGKRSKRNDDIYSKNSNSNNNRDLCQPQRERQRRCDFKN